MITPLFVRCVGIGTGIRQRTDMRAYDYRLICALRGEGEIFLERERHTFSEGDVYIIKPASAYRVVSSDSQTIAVINFDGNCNYSHIQEPIESVRSSFFYGERVLNTELPIELPEAPLHADRETLEILSEMYDIYMRGDKGNATWSFSLSSRLMYVLSKAAGSSSIKSSLRVSDKIYAYILNNATDAITISQTARHFNYSESYVSKVIRSAYNTSFKQLVIDIRMRKALWLLENTELSCAQISSALGFSGPGHFSAAFKKKFGKSPKSLR